MTDNDAMAEIRALSPEARALILHKLRNSLFIAFGNLNLIPESADIASRSILAKCGRAIDACRRLDREITEMFGGDHA